MSNPELDPTLREKQEFAPILEGQLKFEDL